MSGNTNPGNFANRPKEEVREIASKGGKASHSGGFASMDPDKQVCSSVSASALFRSTFVAAALLSSASGCPVIS